MFRRVQDFKDVWSAESSSTLRVFRALTDESLKQSVGQGGYTLGSLASHITGSIVAIPAHAGLMPMPEKSELKTVGEIIAAYEKNAQDLSENVGAKWNDAQLGDEIAMFGRNFKRGAVLGIVISHQAHHRAQMTVLMRQAGLKVPGVYGPSESDAAGKKS